MLTYDTRALQRLMDQRGLEDADLAQKAQLAAGTVRYVRRGVSDPRAKTLAKLCNALGVPPTKFFLKE